MCRALSSSEASLNSQTLQGKGENKLNYICLPTTSSSRTYQVNENALSGGFLKKKKSVVKKCLNKVQLLSLFNVNYSLAVIQHLSPKHMQNHFGDSGNCSGYHYLAIIQQHVAIVCSSCLEGVNISISNLKYWEELQETVHFRLEIDPGSRALYPSSQESHKGLFLQKQPGSWFCISFPNQCLEQCVLLLWRITSV